MHISDCCQFSGIHISQGSVAIYLRCGGIVKYELVANLPVSLPVKEFWKSVNIWRSYGQEFSVLFFLRHSVVTSPFLRETGLENCPLDFFYPLDASQCRSKLFSSSSMPSNQVFINVPSVWFLLIYSLYNIWLSFHHIYISSQWTIPNNQQTGSNPNNFICFTLLFWQQKHLYINLSSLPGDALHLQY